MYGDMQPKQNPNCDNQSDIGTNIAGQNHINEEGVCQFGSTAMFFYYLGIACTVLILLTIGYLAWKMYGKFAKKEPSPGEIPLPPDSQEESSWAVLVERLRALRS